MSDTKKNEGIIMSGGSINVEGGIAVGKGAKVTVVTSGNEPINNDTVNDQFGSRDTVEAQVTILLRDLLIEHFNVSELKSICFNLNIDDELLSSNTKLDIVLDLIKFCVRRGRVQELVSLGQSLRPNASWPQIDER
jgi:hypothetical protein